MELGKGIIPPAISRWRRGSLRPRDLLLYRDDAGRRKPSYDPDLPEPPFGPPPIPIQQSENSVRL